MTLRLLITILTLCTACGGGSSNNGQNQNPSGSNPPPGGSSFGLTQRVPVTGLNFPTGQAQPGSTRVSDAFPGLDLAGIHLAYPPDGSDRLFIVRRDGEIDYFTNDPASSTVTPFLDISSRVTTTGEAGMLSMAFDPDFAANGHYYVFYVTETGGPLRSIVSRFEANAGNRETILLSMNQSAYHHKGGMLAFGPDGMLYISVGDSGPSQNAQNLQILLGKILRIDPSRTSPGLNYAIPNDNPFVGMPFTWTGPGTARGEIWAYGLRNPWRFSFDGATLWLGDVGADGQNAREEINIITRGTNYGWPHYEGESPRSQVGNPTMPNHLEVLDPSAITGPVFAYGHPGSGDPIAGQSVIGGYVYRGSRNPSLTGAYIFTDIVGSRSVWAFSYSGSPLTQAQVMANGTPVREEDVTAIASGISNIPVSFGQDADGEIYTIGLASSGMVEVYGFSPNGAPSGPTMPPRLSETGLFSDLANLTPSPGIIEYAVNSPLWSDWAVKRRWIALPGSQQITFSATGNWEFPIGTVLVKHFELGLSASQTRRLETRVLIHQASGWAGHTYKWNDAQTDADLMTLADSDPFTVEASAAGGARNQSWYYPATECLACHTDITGGVLGVRTGQINGDFDYPSMTDNQLRAWNNIGLFSSNIGDASQYAAMADPADTGTPISQRARSYLAANCSQCHAPNGPTPLNIDFRAETPANQMNIIDRPPQSGNMGIPNAQIVARDQGDKSNSVLWHRLQRLDSTRMPPLGSNIADPLGVEVIGGWIDAGAP